MAVLATPDWTHHTRDNRMDVPTNNSRQRTSPANESSSPHQSQSSPLSPSQSQQPPPPQHLQSLQQQQFQQQQHQQQLLQQQMLLAAQQHSPGSFPYPVQQQPQGSWTPNITAPPFYPSFFQPHQGQQSPQPYPSQIPGQAPYFDPGNAQLAAQWAYQQMMFNAQHAFPAIPPQHHSPSQRPSNPNQSGQPQSPTEYFTQNQVFKQFHSGTPPPTAHRTASGGDHSPPQGQQYPGPGFHPYRRPNRQPSQPHSPADPVTDWRQGVGNIPHPPYARPDASGSTSSVNSSGSRQRTNSNQSAKSNGRASHRNSPAPTPSSQGSARSSPSPAASPPASSGASSPLRQPHHRNSSTSSSTSTSTATSVRPGNPATTTASPPTSASSTAGASVSSNGSATPRLSRPSPLSQGTFTISEKRISRDDIDLGAMNHDAIQAAGSRSAGLKGRLRRALSFNSANILREEDAIQEDDDDVSIKASQLNQQPSINKMKGKAVATASTSKAEKVPTNGTDSGVDDASSTAPPPKKKGRAASLFNSRMNMSTDNISLSSTVSSASVMIRKLGAMGKLARRNSLAGITSLFKDKDKEKDKDKDKDGDKDKKGKKKKSAKSEVSEASVSHVTAELDRMGGDWTVNSAELNGLSPAAKLARQHTLKSNAEAAARAKEAAAAAVAREEAAKGSNDAVAGVPTWDRNTATRQGATSPNKNNLANVRINEDGTRTLVEEDEDESDDGHYDHQQGSSYGSHPEGWEDDEEWDQEGDGDLEEDVTIRAEAPKSGSSSSGPAYDYGPPRPSGDMEPWAVDIRRSVERSRKPARGILKYADTYDQSRYLQNEHTAANRGRANSYTSPAPTTELGPLARIPSPDPDHIDGLHRHNSHSSSHGSHSSSATETTPPSLPPLSFDSASPMATTFTSPGSKDLPPSPPSPTHSENRSSAIFQHPTFNSSAPALSTIGSASSKSPPTLAHRSQTAPIKRLTFASNLSVYDTFSAGVYDRRSEPATWSRLTPALAQRIKEELNSYKMEEMEVHAASRIHTQFFV
ncbi:hypothetical protein CPB83DRAFT_908375 [Crepidotus variabilis]|uniref:Uncharacterized protein n=1 Tax=Crepidotus variabilis TaxID=179855 RepID=A0A9P6ECH2_9AGAR|nr:hypothetical protein CPB83DRAFT_908375 [Crepidotus variabilis]